MLNKRVKAGIKKIHKPEPKIRLCLGTLSVIALCIFLLTAATFTQIKISFNVPDTGISSYLKFEYIPQIPVVIFIAALLGEYWGVVVILIYIIMGLTPMFPVFALGGGLSYIFQYNFGYIFGFIPAVFVSAKMLKRRRILNIILSVLSGVLIIHATGIVYLTIIALLRHDSFDFIRQVIYYQSISKILYDFVFSFLAVLTAKGLKKILWILLG